MPNNENGYTAIESSPPTPLVERAPDSITSLNPDLEQGITRRDFIKAAAVTSIGLPAINRQANPEEEAVYIEIEKFKVEIFKIWKFKIEVDTKPEDGDDIPLYLEQQLRVLKEIKNTLMFFPPNLGDMLAESYTNFDNTPEDKAQATNLITANVQKEFSINIKELGKVDYEKVKTQVDIGGVAVSDDGIGLDNDVQTSAIDRNYNIKTVLIHELGHFFYFVANSPTIMAAKRDKNPYLGEEYLNIAPEVPRNAGFISPYSMFNSHEDFAETFETIFTDGGLLYSLERMNTPVDRALIAKVQMAREIASLVTHGEMDKQYFEDLENTGAPKNIDYWTNKKPEEHWMLKDPESENILYIGDINSSVSSDPVEPIMMLASQSTLMPESENENATINKIKVANNNFYVYVIWSGDGSLLELIREDQKVAKTLPLRFLDNTQTKVILRTTTTEYEFEVKVNPSDNGGVNIVKKREEGILPTFTSTNAEQVEPDKGTLIPIILGGKKLLVRMPRNDTATIPTTDSTRPFNTVMSRRGFLTKALRGSAAVAVTSLLATSSAENNADSTLNTVNLVKKRFNRPAPQFVS